MKKLYIILFIIIVCFTISCKRVDDPYSKRCKSEFKLNTVSYLFSIYDIKVYRFYDKGRYQYMYIKKKDVEGISENIQIEESKQ